MFRDALLLCLGILAASACATDESFRRQGLRTAEFDLQCPSANIDVVVLSEGPAVRGSKVGVRGCGLQTTYVLDADMNWQRGSEVQAFTAASASATSSPMDSGD